MYTAVVGISMTSLFNLLVLTVGMFRIIHGRPKSDIGKMPMPLHARDTGA